MPGFSLERSDEIKEDFRAMVIETRKRVGEAYHLCHVSKDDSDKEYTWKTAQQIDGAYFLVKPGDSSGGSGPLFLGNSFDVMVNQLVGILDMDFIQTEAYPSSKIYDKEPDSLDSELASDGLVTGSAPAELETELASAEPLISIDFSKIEIDQDAAVEALLDPIMYTIIPSPVIFTFPDGKTATFSKDDLDKLLQVNQEKRDYLLQAVLPGGFQAEAVRMVKSSDFTLNDTQLPPSQIEMTKLLARVAGDPDLPPLHALNRLNTALQRSTQQSFVSTLGSLSISGEADNILMPLILIQQARTQIQQLRDWGLGDEDENIMTLEAIITANQVRVAENRDAILNLLRENVSTSLGADISTRLEQIDCPDWARLLQAGGKDALSLDPILQTYSEQMLDNFMGGTDWPPDFEPLMDLRNEVALAQVAKVDTASNSLKHDKDDPDSLTLSKTQVRDPLKRGIIDVRLTKPDLSTQNMTHILLAASYLSVNKDISKLHEEFRDYLQSVAESSGHTQAQVLHEAVICLSKYLSGEDVILSKAHKDILTDSLPDTLQPEEPSVAVSESSSHASILHALGGPGPQALSPELTEPSVKQEASEKPETEPRGEHGLDDVDDLGSSAPSSTGGRGIG